MAGNEATKSKVVAIKRSRGNNTEVTIFTGTIIIAEPRFCYVIVSCEMIKDGYTYEVCFPGGVTSKVHDFSLPPYTPVRSQRGNLAAFDVWHQTVPYDINSITAADLGNLVSMFQEVHICEFNLQMDLIQSAGRVNTVSTVDGNNFFVHDCPPSTCTRNGAPVFDSDDKLVGICYNTMGVCYTHDMIEIQNDLLKLEEAQGIEPPTNFWEFVDYLKERFGRYLMY